MSAYDRKVSIRLERLSPPSTGDLFPRRNAKTVAQQHETVKKQLHFATEIHIEPQKQHADYQR